MDPLPTQLLALYLARPNEHLLKQVADRKWPSWAICRARLGANLIVLLLHLRRPLAGGRRDHGSFDSGTAHLSAEQQTEKSNQTRIHLRKFDVSI